MSQFVARSVMRAVSANGGRSGRFISTASFARQAEIGKPNVASPGVFYFARTMNSTAEAAVAAKEKKKESAVGKEAEKGVGVTKTTSDGAVISSYWGITRPKITLEDGTVWPWNCFMPWETYRSDTTIDLSKHHVPKTFLDKVALKTVKLLRLPTDIFFKRRYGCRAMMLETVAAVPGMVGGMLLHLRSLRKFQQSGGWIKALLEEAENERMHLMTMVELVQPKWYERLLVLTVQGVFFNAYFVLYYFPRSWHIELLDIWKRKPYTHILSI